MTPTATPTLTYQPTNLGRWLVWGGTLVLFLILPVFFKHGFARAMMSQMGIMIIFALSYNMLLGQSGMLSFGHAVYSGLGAYFAIHTLNLIGAGTLAIPVSLVPLVGAFFGMLFGIVFGYPTTQKSGTPFAMITLGIAEMVYACSLMFPGFFGGEGGISGNRTVGGNFLGIKGLNFGPDIQVYYLVAFWCFVSMIAMFAWTHTPLGRIANAVRDNPERVEFIGYNTQRVRWLVLILSSFFAGLAGGLTAINFEIVTAETVGAFASGKPLFAAFIGGLLFFFGPIIGAVAWVFFEVALSGITKAWLLYLGLFFVLLVMFAPGGLSSLILMNLRVMKFGKMKRLLDPYLGVALSALTLLIGAIMMIELTYHLTLEAGGATTIKLFGFPLDTHNAETWTFAVATTLGGAMAFEYMRRRFKREWDAIQEEIEDWVRENPEQV